MSSHPGASSPAGRGSERREPAAAGESVGAGPPGPGRSAARRFGLLVVLLVVVVVLLRLTPLRALVSRSGALAALARIRATPAAPLLFVVHAVAAALALPGSALTLAGGAVSALWPGVVLNLAGATVGATVAVRLARALGRDFVSRRLRGRAAALDRTAEPHGFRGIQLLRLVPLVPFNALNSGAGLSAVRLRDYVLASAVGMLPGTFAYTYFADAILAGSAEARRDANLHVIVAGALLVLLRPLPRLRRCRSGRAAP
ncbi:MAG: TVP38/TMEM64 family protein [Gemmatimonadetes bacterium]|nr:TVP38/TMEM64 family protein [Gemmatimonadota bacterium]